MVKIGDLGAQFAGNVPFVRQQVGEAVVVDGCQWIELEWLEQLRERRRACCGGCGREFGDDYRRRAITLLRDAGFEPVDPMRRDFRGRTQSNEETIVSGDLADIDACDGVLVSFAEPDEGTAMEAWYVHSRGIAVVAYTSSRTPHPWTVYVARSRFDDLHDAVRALASLLAADRGPRHGASGQLQLADPTHLWFSQKFSPERRTLGPVERSRPPGFRI